MICKECGAYNSDRAKFCKVCGASLSETLNDNVSDAEEITVPAADVADVTEDEVEEPVREQEMPTTRFTKKQPVSNTLDEDEDEEDEDEEDEDDVTVRSSRSSRFSPVKKQSRLVADDEDDDIDDEDEYDEDEVKPSRPQKGLFSKRSNKSLIEDEDDDDEDDEEEENVKVRPKKKAARPAPINRRYEDDEAEDDENDEDDEEEEVKARPVGKNSRQASAKQRYDEDDEDEDDEDEDDDDEDEYEEYESTPPRSKKRSGKKSNPLAILLAIIAIIIVILIALVVFCNNNAAYREMLPSFLQFSACAKEAEAPAPVVEEVPVETDALPEEEPIASENEMEPIDEHSEGPVQEYVPEEFDTTQAPMEDTVDENGAEAIKVKVWLQPGETVTAVLPHQDNLVHTNNDQTYLGADLIIPKACYNPNEPLENAEYVVTPEITVTAVDGTVSKREVGSFTMTFPKASLQITEPAEIPEDGIMCPEGNVLHIEGKTDNHTVSVTANGQTLGVYADGVIIGDYTLPGDEAEEVVITAAGDNLVTTSTTITVRPYVFVPDPMELSVDGTAAEHKANVKNGKFTVTGKVTPGSEVVASCDYEDVKCGSVLVSADGSYSFEVTFGSSTYGMFAINLHSTQEGHEEGDVTTYVYRMYADKKAFIKGFSKSKNYTEMPNKKVTFESVMTEPGANAAYRFTGKVESVTEIDGFSVVQMTVTVNTNKETKTVYVIDMNMSKYDFQKNVGNTCKVYCTLNGLYSDGDSLSLICWFAQK